jgi:hypothetical protein
VRYFSTVPRCQIHVFADGFGCRKEDYDKARLLLNEAAKSGSYMYPIKVLYLGLSPLHCIARVLPRSRKCQRIMMTDRYRASSTSSPIPSCGSLCAQGSSRT